MDRRHFLAASGLAAASPVLGQATAAVAEPLGAPEPSTQVNFYSDGENPTPLEYATRLQRAAAEGKLAADDYSLGGAVELLEKTFAEALGKEAAMWVPTGTLANLLAVRKLAGPDRRVLVQAESHLYNDSGDGASLLGGLNQVPLGAGETAMSLEQVQAWVARSAGGRVETRIGALSIESPVRRRDHAFVPFEQLQALCAYARGQGIRLHLDGSRLFLLPQHTGKGVREYAALFDTVYVSVWKHFDATSGAILAGDADFIEGLYHQRRMFGSALPQAWPMMALAASSVAGFEARYAQAWQAAERVFMLLKRGDARFSVRRVANGTCRFYLSMPGVDADRFSERARASGIMVPGMPPGGTEMTMQVNTSLLRVAPEEIARRLLEAAA